MELLSYKDFLTEANINPLYKEFLIRERDSKSNQLKLDFHFTEDMMTKNERIFQEILQKFDFISIGFEFELYVQLKTKTSKLIEVLTPIKNEPLSKIIKYFKLDKSNKKVSDLFNTNTDFNYILKNINNSNSLKVSKTFDSIINSFDDKLFGFITKLNLTANDGYEFTVNTGSKSIAIYEKVYDKKDKHLSIEQLRDKLSNVLKRDVVIHTKYHQTDKNINNWYIEPDGSLKKSIPSGKGYEGIEIVSAVYPAKDFQSVFETFYKFINSYGLNPQTNSATGLHFSMSFNNREMNKSINPLKLIVLGKDNFWLKKVNRSFNKYCQSQFDLVIENIQKLIDNGEITSSKLSQTQIKKINDTIPIDVKYFTANFKKYNSETGDGYIEFRLLGNDYLDKFKNTTITAINWFLFMFVIGGSKNLFEDEYKSIIEKKISDLLKKPLLINKKENSIDYKKFDKQKDLFDDKDK